MKLYLKYIYTFLILMSLSYSMIGQEEFYSDSLVFSTPEQLLKKDDYKKLKFGVDVGTSFMTYGKSNMFNSYVAPHVSYPINEKFSVEVGMSVSHGNFFNAMNPYYSEYYSTGNMNLLQTSLFARGKYALNNNITIYGTTRISRFSLLNSFEEGNAQDYNLQSMSFGLEYKFNNGSSIYIEVQNGNNYNPYSNGIHNQMPFGSRRSAFGF